MTALNFAVSQNCESITTELLSHPDIDVNKQDNVSDDHSFILFHLFITIRYYSQPTGHA